MPTYEYHCDACGHDFEKFQPITSDPIKKCPNCGKNKVRRLIGTGAGLIFKGSGFYITDYRDKSYGDKAKAESGASADSSKPADAGAKPETPAKTESKPAAETPKHKSESKHSKSKKKS